MTPSPSVVRSSVARQLSPDHLSRSSTSSNLSGASTFSQASALSNAASSSLSYLSQTSTASTCSSSITSFADFIDPFASSAFVITEEGSDEEVKPRKSEKSLPPTPTSPSTSPRFSRPPRESTEQEKIGSPFLDPRSPDLEFLVPWIRISITISGHATIFLLTANDPTRLDARSIHLSVSVTSLMSNPPKVVYDEKRLKGSGPPSWERKYIFDLQTETGETVSDIVNVVRAASGIQWDGTYVGEGDASRGGSARCRSFVAEALAVLQSRRILHQRSVVCARTVGSILAYSKNGDGVCC